MISAGSAGSAGSEGSEGSLALPVVLAIGALQKVQAAGGLRARGMHHFRMIKLELPSLIEMGDNR